MQIHRNAVEIVIQTPAKLNLFFEVLGKRDDGYHEIENAHVPDRLVRHPVLWRNVGRGPGIGVWAGFACG